MKGKLDLIFSFSIYAFGLLAMVLSDIYVSQYYGKVEIAEWAFLKSSILIIGGVCLLGYDFTFVRDPTLIKRVFGNFISQTILISLGITFILYLVKDLSPTKGLLIFVNIVLFSLLSFFAASSRANFKLWKSQFSTNFWKILMLICLLIFPLGNLVYAFLISFFVSIIVSILLKGYFPDSTKKEILSKVEARKIGLAYILYNITLTLSIYSEQFLINLNGDVVCSEHLFRYFAIFTPIALSVNGFLGFYFGPKFRIENNMNVTKFKKFTYQISFFSFIISVLSLLVGLAYVKFFAANNFKQLDYFIIIMLTLMCFVRGLYTSSSVCLGVFASAQTIKKIAYFNWAYFFAYSLSIFCVLIYFKGIDAARIISVLSLIHWILRYYTAAVYSLNVVKNLNS